MDESHKGRRCSRSAFFRARRAAREDKPATRCQCAASGLSRVGRFSIQCSPLRFDGAPFKPLSRHSLAVGKTDGCGIPRSALTRYRTRRTGSVRQGTVSR
ncbi:hypothetical protein GJ842_14705 [Salmonella enterica]|nr:hypothetical protein [Salmonella enterica]